MDFKITSLNIPEILEHYQNERNVYLQTRKAGKPDFEPLVMNYITFDVLRDYSLRLLPHNRDAVLCFEHFRYESVCNLREVKPKSTKLPQHLLVLQIKFLRVNSHMNIGTIGYSDFTDRWIIAEVIKEFIEDCYRCDLRVIASCSSAKLELMCILSEMPINTIKPTDLVLYEVRGRGVITHIFDPAWLMRKLKVMFFNQDVIFNQSHRRFVASFDNVIQLLDVSRLQGLFEPEIYDVESRSTAAAVKTFSNNVAVLLEAFYNPIDKSKPKYPEAEGTSHFIQLFDQVFDSLNAFASDNNVDNKPYRYPLTNSSRHWVLWEMAIPTIETMRFARRSLNCLNIISRKPDKEKSKKKRKNNVNNIIKFAGETLEFYDDEYKLDPSEIKEEVTDKTATSSEKSSEENSIYIMSEVNIKLECSEALYKAFEDLAESVREIKKTSKYKQLLSNVECLVNINSVYNAELRLRWTGTTCYEYLSFKMAKYLRRVVGIFKDSDVYFLSLIKELTKLSEILRFLNLTIFQWWLASIAGIKSVFKQLERSHCTEFNTKVVSCDSIYSFVETVRTENGFKPRKIVSNDVFGHNINFAISIMALTSDFNLTINSKVLGEYEKPKKGNNNKKKKKYAKRNRAEKEKE